MSEKRFCDDCRKILDASDEVSLWFFHIPFRHLKMCYTCFSKHWNPQTDKFTLKTIHELNYY